MDTREKFVAVQDLADLLASGEWIVVVGQFDPMTAAQARRLAAIKKKESRLLALVVDSGSALLPNEARAALVAGLRAVDAVTIARGAHWQAAVPDNLRVSIQEDAAAEEWRSAEFVSFVLRRQASAARQSQ